MIIFYYNNIIVNVYTHTNTQSHTPWVYFLLYNAMRRTTCVTFIRLSFTNIFAIKYISHHPYKEMEIRCDHRFEITALNTLNVDEHEHNWDFICTAQQHQMSEDRFFISI